MEKELNIAEILKDKPQGTKLYDLLYNVDVELDTISNTDTETVVWCTNKTDNNTTCHRGYSEFGTVRGCPDGLQILFPSKLMQDWSKFAWKKGDVLICKDNTHIIFEKFEDNTYTRFKGKHYLFKLYTKEDYSKETPQMTTSSFEKANDYETQSYIKTIEKKFGGKLNRETLEIEKAQPEFKDGDILYITDRIVSCNFIMIYKNQEGDRIYHYATLPEDNLVIMTKRGFLSDNGGLSKRYATEEEKQQLFEALAKEGKAWDAERKQIVDLKPKWTPKPFDRVITRVNNDVIWTANIFSHIDRHGKYVTIGCISGYRHCIPYNEETESLIKKLKKKFASKEWKVEIRRSY